MVFFDRFFIAEPLADRMEAKLPRDYDEGRLGRLKRRIFIMKKALSLAIAAVLAFSLTACGNAGSTAGRHGNDVIKH